MNLLRRAKVRFLGRRNFALAGQLLCVASETLRHDSCNSLCYYFFLCANVIVNWEHNVTNIVWNSSRKIPQKPIEGKRNNLLVGRQIWNTVQPIFNSWFPYNWRVRRKLRPPSWSTPLEIGLSLVFDITNIHTLLDRICSTLIPFLSRNLSIR